MKHHFSKIAICVLAGILFTACRKDSDEFSEIPTVKWRGSNMQTVGDPQDNRRNMILKVYFNDRDGDIGSLSGDEADSCDYSDYNFFIRYFEKVGGTYKEVMPVDSCQPFHIVLPDLTPKGQNKVLEGVINNTFSYFAFPKNGGVDSVKFEVQLKDRAGHLSNIAYSPPIFIPQ